MPSGTSVAVCDQVYFFAGAFLAFLAAFLGEDFFDAGFLATAFLGDAFFVVFLGAAFLAALGFSETLKDPDAPVPFCCFRLPFLTPFLRAVFRRELMIFWSFPTL